MAAADGAFLDVAAGLLASMLAALVLRRLLFGVGALDLPSYGAVATLLMLTTLVSVLLPAIRASRVDPVEALRHL